LTTIQWSRTESWPADAAHIATARRFVQQHLTEHGRGDAVPDVSLLVSELVTNAIRHAGTAFAVTLVITSNAVRLEVSDGSPQAPVIADVTHEDDGGRGLRIVAALSHDWGVTRDPAGGKSVWASVLTVPRQRA
jgi:anti-sigma regulatory factor (Ser/Thr protein kinase)